MLARLALTTPETFVVSLASSDNPIQVMMRESAVTVMDGARRFTVPVPWFVAVPTTVSVMTDSPWLATTTIAPAQWSPTPLTVTSVSPAPAIFPKTVSVETFVAPGLIVFSNSLVHPPGVVGVPAAVAESEDSMMMYMASPETGASAVGTAARKLVVPLPKAPMPRTVGAAINPYAMRIIALVASAAGKVMVKVPLVEVLSAPKSRTTIALLAWVLL